MARITKPINKHNEMSREDSVDYLNTKVRISFQQDPRERYVLSKIFRKEDEVLLVELPPLGGKGAGSADIISLFHTLEAGLLIEFGLIAKGFLNEVNKNIVQGVLKVLRRNKSVTSVFLFRKDGKIMATVLVPAKLSKRQSENFSKSIHAASKRKKFRGVYAFAPNSGELVPLEIYYDPTKIRTFWQKIVDRYNNWKYPSEI